MECKFLSNGIAIQYHNFLKPCCVWKGDDQWIKDHNLKSVDIVNWHDHKDLIDARKTLAQNQWPAQCIECKTIEDQGRQDSMRLNGASAYSNFSQDDITLEIRPGNVCNFACQTCWTPASTRVAEFYRKADIPDPFENFIKNDLTNFDFLLPVKQRLKKIIILGGEPFYDPKCLDFLQWCLDNTSAELMAFTNGSVVDLELLSKSNRRFTLIFSLDAVGRPAEYIRFGTKWHEVLDNFNLVRNLDNVDVRVNITTSVYNFYYFSDVIDLLIPDWPSVVSFGPAMEDIYSERVIPIEQRQLINNRLYRCLDNISNADIEDGQKSNALNAVQAIINNLNTAVYDPDLHGQFKTFVEKMDSVKKIKLQDFCPEIANLLD